MPVERPPAAQRKTLRDVIRNFAPAWFAVTMGTGVISILFYAFPYGTGSQALKVLTLAFFFLNLLLFVVFSAISVARYIMFPDTWSIMIRHPVQSLYTGTFPMGATTLINIAVHPINIEYGIGGKPFLYILWAIWWADVVASVICCWGMVHFMETGQTHALEKMTAVWLLPVVTLIVASSTGGILALALVQYSLSHAITTALVSVFMVTIGLSLAMMMLTVYLLRLIIYGLPPGATVISAFLPLGPTGQAGYSILLAGQFFKSILPLQHSSSEFLSSKSTGDTIQVICVCISFVLWSLASMWVLFAVLAVQNVVRQTNIPFRVPFWGLIFPNGVYANLTISLYHTLGAPFFRTYGAIYAVATVILWVYVTARTVVMVHSREIFEAPCLEDVDVSRLARTVVQDERTKRENGPLTSR